MNSIVAVLFFLIFIEYVLVVVIPGLESIFVASGDLAEDQILILILQVQRFPLHHLLDLLVEIAIKSILDVFPVLMSHLLGNLVYQLVLDRSQYSEQWPVGPPEEEVAAHLDIAFFDVLVQNLRVEFGGRIVSHLIG
jgi:hypothetical protein